MKKTYTRKQITEAIAYWKKQLNTMNEANEHEADAVIDDAIAIVKTRFDEALQRALETRDVEDLLYGSETDGHYDLPAPTELADTIIDIIRQSF